MYAGLVSVPIDIAQLKENCLQFIDSTGAKAIWVENKECIVTRPDNVAIIGGSPLLLGSDSAMQSVVKEENDIAVLVATSGTTGKPRFVMVTHGNLLANTEAIVKSQHLEENECAILILQISYCYGASILHTHLYKGGSVVFDPRFMFPDKVLYAAVQHKCTTFAGVPSVYKILLNRSHLGSIGMPDLRRFLQAGGSLDIESIEEVKRRVPVDFYVMYGQTEATARIACLDPSLYEFKKGSVGKLLENLEGKLISENIGGKSSDNSGLLYVRGPSISPGYYNDPEATAEKFVNGWLNTQDVVRMDSEGFIWVIGRAGEFLKIRGKRVAYSEIEQKVRTFEGVLDAAVVSIKHDEAGEVPFVFFIPAHQDTVRISEAIKQGLPQVWTCQGVVPVSEFPLTERGKLNRKKLTEMVRT
jgi:acyl-coenzyme A synthetase/AMP-(fatty) acid ligase